MNADRWKEILGEEARCKKAETCNRLKVRELFFEPNPDTLPAWQEKHRFYEKGIDRRLVFLAERPSDRRPQETPAHFLVDGQRGWCCWDFSQQDERFRKGRMRYGFQNCLMTNVVKCGLSGARAGERPSDKEAQECSRFLAMELEAIRPTVVACLGNSSLQIFLRHTMPQLSFTPCPIKITHYSFYGAEASLFSRWDQEFATIKEALKARGVSEDRPEYTSLPK